MEVYLVDIQENMIIKRVGSNRLISCLFTKLQLEPFCQIKVMYNNGVSYLAVITSQKVFILVFIDVVKGGCI